MLWCNRNGGAAFIDSGLAMLGIGGNCLEVIAGVTNGCRGRCFESEVVDQLRALGVEAGGVLLVHTSFRALRPIEGGPLGLIAALRTALGPEGTLVMPSWTGDDATPFDPATTAAAPDLGVTADFFWRQPGTVRSDHASPAPPSARRPRRS